MQIYSMRVQNLRQPIGIGTERPFLGWKLKSDKVNEKQTAYRIVVAVSEEDLETGEHILWDSGKVEDSACTGIRYAGKALQSGQIAYWRVKVWDKEGNESNWSRISFWEMGNTPITGFTRRLADIIRRTMPEVRRKYLECLGRSRELPRL